MIVIQIIKIVAEELDLHLTLGEDIDDIDIALGQNLTHNASHGGEMDQEHGVVGTVVSTVVSRTTEDSLEELGYPFFVLIFVQVISKLGRHAKRVNSFKTATLDEALSQKTAHYDPEAVWLVAKNLKRCGSFSLLKLLPWAHDNVPRMIEDCCHKFNKEKERAWKGGIVRKCCDVLLFALALVWLIVCAGLLILMIGIGLLGLAIKLEQVTFVGQKEVLDWSWMQCVQFLAFLNNMLALDTGKHQSLRAVDNVLFGGGDGVESIRDRRAEKHS